MNIRSYDLFLDVDFQGLTFEGKVRIELESEEDVVLDSVGLKILSVEGGRGSLNFEQKSENLVIKTGQFSGTLEVKYWGTIHDNLVGIYRAPYNNTHMITTQFEAAHARRMLPCVDRPDYKATFKLAVRVNTDLDVISNMPIESLRIIGNKKTVTFQKTPKMSTYLFYLGIGKFEEAFESFGNIDVIVATTRGKTSKGRFASDVTKQSMKFYQDYFGIPYMLPKIHLIMVPEFAAGAMENWGAITFRETALLVDENSSTMTRKRVAEVVAHELAHLWFGDLVTLKWWNDLWLNESFATLMAYKVLATLYPQWKAFDDFLLNENSRAMARDSLKSTHPIEVDVTSPTEIAQIFDDISYSKGASILRMIEAYVGADDFRKAVYRYLTIHEFSNATGKDFWSSLDTVSGKQLTLIMSEWVRKPGYPVITATIIGDRLRLKQERFLLSGTYEKDIRPIPVTMSADGESRRLLFDTEETWIDVKEHKSLNLNVDHSGFYRVYYEGLYDQIWNSELSPLDRWQMIFDACAFLVAGKMSFTEYLNLIRKYNGEQEYLPAREVSDQLSFLSLIMPERVREVSREFYSSQLRILEGKTDETSSMLRGTITGRLAMIDDGYARDLGSKFRDYEKIEPDMKAAVARAYARAYGDLEGLVKKYRVCTSDEERDRLRTAMVSLKEPTSVAISLGLAWIEVKTQDSASMILAAATNPDARDVAWTWIKVNIERLRKIHEGTGTLSRILLSVIPILGIGKVEEVERFFKENEMPEATKGIEAGLERLRIYDRFVKNV
jgi:tricorn protease interacting factor F2/3